MLAFKTIFIYISGPMKRFFIGFFTLLGVLLLNIPTPSEAHAYRINRVSSTESLEIPRHVIIFNAESDDVTLIHRPTSEPQVFHKLDIAEVEEEVDYEQVLPVPRKISSDNNHFSAIFCAQTLGYFFTYSKEVLAFQKYFSYTASNRYLMLLVFRI
jgi:hypothetical protein